MPVTKPSWKGPLGPHLVANPDFQWVWNDDRHLLPMLEGHGDPHDFSRREFRPRVGAAPWRISPVGLGLNFNGSSQYLNLGKSFGSHLGQYTATFVFRTASTAAQALAGSFSDGTALGWEMNLNRDAAGGTATGRLRVYQRMSGTSELSAATTVDAGFTDNRIHVVSIVVDHSGANNVDFYVDGIEVAASYAAQETAGTYTGFQYDAALAARNVRGVVDQHFNGELQLASFHSRLLTPTQIRRIHTDPFGPFRPRLWGPELVSAAGTAHERTVFSTAISTLT